MAEYIERDALLKKAIKEQRFVFWKDDVINNERVVLTCYKDLEDVVRSIPAADVAPVAHGNWISWEEADNFIPSARRHECSVCHDAAQVLVNGLELLSDYCPNCGARMDGDRE